MRLVLLTSLLLGVAACSEGSEPVSPQPSADAGRQQWALPAALREISGLALTEDERLLAVTDELAVVYELDFDAGGLVKRFAFGQPVARDDFEGITVAAGRVWLMTSDGVLYSAQEGGDGQFVDYERIETGIGRKCELEGLATSLDGESLVLLCKNGRDQGRIRIHNWRIADDEHSDQKLPEKEMKKAAGSKRIRPTGIARYPDSDRWAILAGPQHIVFDIDEALALNDVIMSLDAERHRQAEGIEITRDGRLIIADEGGKGAARLAVYRLDYGNKKN